ncbi:hypothetical protein H2200_010811 [Cladophialophora chaetospira]|uniref:Fungal N-terminal domain-containing protein n=1 Tax=Cladophialophora chaetospira TaxID=386627 RepID=A0AA38X0Y8_9EURO|nr:hypothetical protein H2200_010811 [Cladophialophora chaetospira]
MSFGFSITDLKEVIKLSWDLYTALKDGPEDINNIARDLTTVYGVLNQIQNDLESRHSAIKSHGEGRLKMLRSMTINLKATLDQVQKLVDKFRPMAAGSKLSEQLWIKVKWIAGQHKIKRLHQDISFHISSFNLLMTSMGNSSLQRIETGLEEMRVFAEEHSKVAAQSEEPTKAATMPKVKQADVDNQLSSNLPLEMQAPLTRSAEMPDSDSPLSTEWLVPVVPLASDEFVTRMQQLSDDEQQELAEVVFSNCRLACYDFYHVNGLWRMKYSRQDSPHERKLFQLDGNVFPRSPDDLELREWLAKLVVVHARVNDPDGIQTRSIRNYEHSSGIFANITLIPTLLDPFGRIDPYIFEDRLVLTFFLCEHLCAMNAASRLKVLWKEIHNSSFGQIVHTNVSLALLAAPHPDLR